MSKSKEIIESLQSLLAIEREEDVRQYREKIAASTIQERKENGIAWYPLRIVERGYGIGEYPYLIVERAQKDHHVIRAGNTVEFFCQTESEQSFVKCIVQFIDRQRAKLVLQQNDFPDWLRLGKLGFHLYHDERTFNVMDEALENVLESENNRLSEIREVLLNDLSTRFSKEEANLNAPHLNESQRKAVQACFNAQDLCIIHGPPGTGKTSTLIEAIPLLAKREKQVLVCAPSNAATDLLATRLTEKGCNVLRLGNISRMDASIVDLTLDGRLKGRPEMKEIKRMKKEAEEYRRLANKYKRSFGHEERIQRRALRDQAKEIGKQIRLTEDYLIEMLLGQADVICTTLVGSAHRILKERHFETVIIDEAAQALEPATWIPIQKANKVILAGDPFQLPPTVKSNEATRKGLNKTLMERCLEKPDCVFLLDTQYRMHERIMGFSNRYFYKDALKAAEQVAFATLRIEGMEERPLEFIDTAGTGFEEKQNSKSRSYYNPDEYDLIGKHLTKLLSHLPEEHPYSIGIIAPYKEQVTYMKEQVKSHFAAEHLDILSVNTIDSFQGQERDVIYISLVRSNSKGEIGFLKDYRRMNVAMTRAKRKLVIIGDSATLASDPFYGQMLDYCEQTTSYFSAWEWN